MTLTFLILSAALGLIVGSFLNVVIYRLPRDMSVAQPSRSFCPHCRAAIAWHDNIPVLSWLVLRGRCRNCRSSISMQYPLIELICAIVFVAVFDALEVGNVRTGITGGAWDAVLLVM